MMAPEMIPSVIPGMEGTFNATATSTIITGKKCSGVMTNISDKAFDIVVTLLKSLKLELCPNPKMKNINSDIP